MNIKLKDFIQGIYPDSYSEIIITDRFSCFSDVNYKDLISHLDLLESNVNSFSVEMKQVQSNKNCYSIGMILTICVEVEFRTGE